MREELVEIREDNFVDTSPDTIEEGATESRKKIDEKEAGVVDQQRCLLSKGKIKKTH